MDVPPSLNWLSAPGGNTIDKHDRSLKVAAALPGDVGGWKATQLRLPFADREPVPTAFTRLRSWVRVPQRPPGIRNKPPVQRRFIRSLAVHLIDRERPPRATACGTGVARHLDQTSRQSLACDEDVVTSGCCLRRFGHADLRSNRADECQLKSPASSFGNVWFQDSAVNITKPTLQSNQLQMIDTGQITTSD